MNVHPSLVIGEPVEIRDGAAQPEPMVRFENISKTYPAYRGKPGVNALQGVDFAIARGSITGVIGRSGAGKSSLVRLINGLEKPTTGRVVVDGRDISALTGRDLRLAQRSIGMIFQHFNLLSSRTAADNIALPLELAGTPRDEITRHASTELHRARWPHRQARALSRRTLRRAEAACRHRPARWRRGRDVLLSDEATSALDPETTHSRFSPCSSEHQRELTGVTIVLITHEMSGHQGNLRPREVVVIEAGRIIESGRCLRGLRPAPGRDDHAVFRRLGDGRRPCRRRSLAQLRI